MEAVVMSIINEKKPRRIVNVLSSQLWLGITQL